MTSASPPFTMDVNEFYNALGACAALSNPFAGADLESAAKSYAEIIRSVAAPTQIDADSSQSCRAVASAPALQIQR